MVLNTYVRPRLVVPEIIAIAEPRGSESILGKLEYVWLYVSLENHRGFQGCLEKLFGLAESTWALKLLGLHQG